VLKNEFPLSTLAHISAGYSAGSIKKTVENVLTEFRLSKVRFEFKITVSCRWNNDHSHCPNSSDLCANTMDD
jgi:hypothetical protein